MCRQRPEIQKYSSWYGISDIVVDEAATDCTTEASYYAPLYAYIQAHGGSEMLNPGTTTSQCYMAATDILDIFEGTYASYVNVTYPAWIKAYPASRFFNEVYSVATANDMTNVVAKTQASNIGWVYVTNLGLPNPYNALPSYWATEVTTVRDAFPSCLR